MADARDGASNAAPGGVISIMDVIKAHADDYARMVSIQQLVAAASMANGVPGDCPLKRALQMRVELAAAVGDANCEALMAQANLKTNDWLNKEMASRPQTYDVLAEAERILGTQQ
jgi:hypothetical protein